MKPGMVLEGAATNVAALGALRWTTRSEPAPTHPRHATATTGPVAWPIATRGPCATREGQGLPMRCAAPDGGETK
jgi:hypothetical protein